MSVDQETVPSLASAGPRNKLHWLHGPVRAALERDLLIAPRRAAARRRTTATAARIRIDGTARGHFVAGLRRSHPEHAQNSADAATAGGLSRKMSRYRHRCCAT